MLYNHDLLRFLASLFLAVTIWLLVGKRFVPTKRDVISPGKNQKKIDARIRVERLAKRRNDILQKPENRIGRFIRSWRQVIEITNTPVERYKLYAFIYAGIGFSMGLFMKNVFLGAILACVGALVPYFNLWKRVRDHRALVKGQLISVLGAINTQYLTEEDLTLAISKKLSTMPDETKQFFAEYVKKVMVLKKDSVTALHELNDSFDNPHFYEWCSLAIQSEQGESGLKYTMQTIPQDMADHERVQREFEIAAQLHRRDFYLRIAMFPALIIFLKISYPEYYGYLVNHIFGQSYLVFCALAVIVLTVLFFRLNRELELS